MVEVEEVGNKMQSQMRLHAAAAEDDDADLPLQALFDSHRRRPPAESRCRLTESETAPAALLAHRLPATTATRNSMVHASTLQSRGRQGTESPLPVDLLVA